MNNKKVLLGVLGAIVIGTGIGGTKGLEKGMEVGAKLGFVAGMTMGVMVSTIVVIGKKKINGRCCQESEVI